MRLTGVMWCGLVCVSIAAFGDGPADRKPTDPHAVTSATQAGSAPLPVEALLTTTYTRGFAHSYDGRKLAYIGDATELSEPVDHERGRHRREATDPEQ